MKSGSLNYPVSIYNPLLCFFIFGLERYAPTTVFSMHLVFLYWIFTFCNFCVQIKHNIRKLFQLLNRNKFPLLKHTLFSFNDFLYSYDCKLWILLLLLLLLLFLLFLLFPLLTLLVLIILWSLTLLLRHLYCFLLPF